MKRTLLIFCSVILFLLIGCSKDELVENEQDMENQTSFNIYDEEEKFNFSEDVIVNLNDAVGMFEVPSDICRDVAVASYSEDFPIKLQEILVHCNDDIDTEKDDAWQDYQADCKSIIVETSGKIPYKDIANAAGVDYLDSTPMLVLDIDKDGM